MKRKKVKRLVSSTNNDVLPSLFGRAEVRLFDFPYTFSEIIDSVSGDANVLLQLNYSSQDVSRKYETLKKLFPSKEELKSAIEELNVYLPMKTEEFELFVSNHNIPKGVIKSSYKDLGGFKNDIVSAVDFNPDKILRVRERHIELNYFEKYTLQIESLTVKEMYKLIDERYLYDSELILEGL